MRDGARPAWPRPDDSLSGYVMPVEVPGGGTFVAASATETVARVTARATDDAPETDLTFYPVPGWTLRIAGALDTAERLLGQTARPAAGRGRTAGG